MNEPFSRLRVPIATYRLQFNREFRFVDAAGIISYLSDLGISDIYSSPVLKAVRGSMHGYDIVDHTMLNPELGSPDNFLLMVSELGKHGMGQICDIVPNHVSIEGGENRLWTDVLENGKSSPWAFVFDIDWKPEKKELENKILLPILGDQYGIVLDNRELRLEYDNGGFFIRYYDHIFPVEPGSYAMILEHDIDFLKGTLPGSDPGLTELLSIVTAIGHLPDCLSTDAEMIDERQREKEVIKRRFHRLYGDDERLRSFVDRNVAVFNGEEGNPESMSMLDELLNRQVYRLSDWRVATEEINYRRFFDINSLAAIRIEEPAMFREVHRLVFDMIGKGQVTGLRVDHPDGLHDPTEYFAILQRECCLHSGSDPCSEPATDESMTGLADQMHFYIIGEKILTGSEKMPDVWPIFGTTGYSFMNTVNGVFVDQGNGRTFDRIYERFIKEKKSFHDVVYEKKKLVMQVGMSSEVNTLGHYLDVLSEKDRHTRDFTLNSLIKAIVEVIACFPVYRTYIRDFEVMDRDRLYVDSALYKAAHRNPAMNRSVFEFLRRVLLLQFPDGFDEEGRQEWLSFVMRFQQITGPVMAKGLEDTAFYVFNRLVSLNEVGGMPERFGTPVEAFHGHNIERMKKWPHSMLATSTHDTKRSEDVRARINVLSELPQEWNDRLKRWSRKNRKHRKKIQGVPVPDRNEEYLLYQTLLGIWPVEDVDEPGWNDFMERIKQYMVKAMREAKENTSWISPAIEYEEAVTEFVAKVMRKGPANEFLEDFVPFQRALSRRGMVNSLSQTLLKITSPGMPDFYQGTELWTFSLVDPDNRRPVDFAKRRSMLKDVRSSLAKDRSSTINSLVGNMDDGKIKLFLTWAALQFRTENRALYEKGEYVPLETTGALKDSLIAFSRREGMAEGITVVPRLTIHLTEDPFLVPLGDEIWKDTAVLFHPNGDDVRYENVLTGEVLEKRDGRSLHAGQVLNSFPVALLRKI